MARLEFTIATKKAAYARAGGQCEAEWNGTRCTNQVSEYDHVTEASLGGKPSLENCAALCGRCHRIKTKERRPEMDKVVRLERKQRGWVRKKAKIPNRGWQRYE